MIVVKITALVQLGDSETIWQRIHDLGGDVSLGVAAELLNDAPDGAMYLERTAQIVSIDVPKESK